jgi:peroxiredoxin Q/BCP
MATTGQSESRAQWSGGVAVPMPGSQAKHVMRLMTLTIVSLLAACAAQQRPDGGKGLLPVGANAPDLTGRDAAGAEVRLSEQHGHPIVVYFYPKDGTPGCTKEACAFRDAWSKFSAQGVTIFGVSRDSEASHVEFRKEHELPFPLVADESGSIQTAYGVPSRLGMAARVSFLVDGSGRIARVWPDVDPGVHADEVLKAAEELHSVEAH